MTGSWSDTGKINKKDAVRAKGNVLKWEISMTGKSRCMGLASRIGLKSYPDRYSIGSVRLRVLSGSKKDFSESE